MAKTLQGFSIIEFLAATLITTVATGAIMIGVSNIRVITDRINTKEKAFEQLLNYTDFWKAKISAGEWEDSNGWDFADEFVLVEKNGNPVKKATLSRKGFPINSDYPYPLYSLETRITWSDINDHSNSPPQEELNLKVYQIDFVK